MRLLVARGFARYLTGIDRRTEVPPTGLIRLRRQRRPPFIYTDEQVLALMERARTAIRQRLVAATYETLIALLAATGMRISEAIKLDHADIDWEQGVVLERERRSHRGCMTSGTRRRSRRSSAGTARAASRSTRVFRLSRPTSGTCDGWQRWIKVRASNGLSRYTAVLSGRPHYRRGVGALGRRRHVADGGVAAAFRRPLRAGGRCAGGRSSCLIATATVLELPPIGSSHA